jgi:hypothetical protein
LPVDAKGKHLSRGAERPNTGHTPLRPAWANSKLLRKPCLAETLGERG